MSVAELAEVFQLGSSLARLETNVGNVVKVIDKIDLATSSTESRLGVVEVTLGRYGERIQNLENRPQTDTSDVIKRPEFDELKAEVRGNRLSWPKIGALVAAIAALTGLAAFADKIIPG